jgi:hypothetical protein
MTQGRTPEEEKDVARHMNERLFRQVGRRRRTSLAVVGLLALAAATCIAFGVYFSSAFLYCLLVAVIFSLFAVMFGILALDAHGHMREIRGRKWKTVTPRFDRTRSSPTSAPLASPDSR